MTSREEQMDNAAEKEKESAYRWHSTYDGNRTLYDYSYGVWIGFKRGATWADSTNPDSKELDEFKKGIQSFKCPVCKQCAAPFYQINFVEENNALEAKLQIAVEAMKKAREAMAGYNEHELYWMDEALSRLEDGK